LGLGGAAPVARAAAECLLAKGRQPNGSSFDPACAAISAGRANIPATSTLTLVLFAWVFGVVAFTSTALAAHLPGLLALQGVSAAGVILVGSLVGPAQVAARLLEFGVLRRLHPLISGRVAACMHPLAASLLMLLGGPAAVAFALLHGAGNGVLTITRGTLPLVLFGARGYGQRQGWLMLPGRLAAAVAPWSFGLLLAHLGANVLWVSAGLGLSAVLALFAIKTKTHTEP
jgi:hypothetical protein